MQFTYYDITSTSFRPSNCYRNTPSGSICFGRMVKKTGEESLHVFKVNKMIATIKQRGETWEIIPLEKMRVQIKLYGTLSEAVCEFFQFPLIDSITYTRGWIDKTAYQDSHQFLLCEGKLLKNSPPGTYLIVNDEVNRTLHLILKTAQGQLSYNELEIDYSQFKNEEEIEARLKKEMEYEDIPIPENFKRCTSVLDVTFLQNLAPSSLKTELERWTPEFLEGITDLTLNYFWVHLEEIANTLIALAKLNLPNIKIHILEYRCLYDTNIQNAINALAKIDQELTGETLTFVKDTFIKLLLNNSRIFSAVPFPHVDRMLQSYYNNPELDATFEIVTPDKSFFVHRIILATFAPKLKEGLFSALSSKQNKFFIFYPTEIVEQFIKVAYGFDADFSNCGLSKLIHLAETISSPSFLGLVNRYVNSQLWLPSNIEELLKTNAWIYLPDPKPFIESVAKQWDDLVRVSADPDTLRKTFLINFWLTQKDRK